MTLETPVNDLDVTDSLDDVAAELYGTPKAEEAPVETPEPEAEAPEAPEAAELEEPVGETDEEEGDDTPKPKKRTTNDRLKQKAAENARLAQELEALRAEIEGLKKPLTTDKPEAKADTGLEKPDPAKFQYGELDPNYMEALADYRADLKIAKFQAELREQQETERQQEAEKRASATLQETATRIEQAGSSKYADFHELVVEGGQSGEYPLTKEMFELVAETGDVAPDILYHLASNPDEAAEVAKLPFAKQALWFGRMEAKFTAPPTPAPKKTTSAPPPPESFAKGAGAKAAPKYDDLDDPRTLEALERELYGKGRR